MGKHVDSLSGSSFERVVVDGGAELLIIKHISAALDWLMRVLRDGVQGAPPRALTVWREGLVSAMPSELDTTIVGMAYDRKHNHVRQVMRDASGALVARSASD